MIILMFTAGVLIPGNLGNGTTNNTNKATKVTKTWPGSDIIDLAVSDGRACILLKIMMSGVGGTHTIKVNWEMEVAMVIQQLLLKF